MTGAELVDDAIGFYDNTTASDAGNTNRRLRVLHYAQLVHDEVWNWRPWRWKHSVVSLTTSGGEGVLPRDFARFGPESYVWDAGDGAYSKAWTETFSGEIFAIRASRPSLLPKMFALDHQTPGETYFGGSGFVSQAWDSYLASLTVGADPLPADLGDGDILLYWQTNERLPVQARVNNTQFSTKTKPTLGTADPPQGSGAGAGSYFEVPYTFVRQTGDTLITPHLDPVDLQIRYERSIPALADNASEIAPLPVSYHKTVLLAGTIAKLQTAKNDVRIYWEKQYAMGLGRMVAMEMPLQSRMKQMPMSVGRNNC